MSDPIDREAAIDALHDEIIRRRTDEDTNDDGALDEFDTEAILRRLPPAQQWILCSEKMPEEYEWDGTKMFGTTISNEVYVTFETLDGERFTEHISFQNGKLSPAEEKYIKAWYGGAKPIAWMPLPEPYKTHKERNIQNGQDIWKRVKLNNCGSNIKGEKNA